MFPNGNVMVVLRDVSSRNCLPIWQEIDSLAKLIYSRLANVSCKEISVE